MAMIWVIVVRGDGAGDGDEFYIDGAYASAAGKIGQPLRVTAGEHTFEARDDDPNRVWRHKHVISRQPGNAEDNPLIVSLSTLPGDSDYPTEDEDNELLKRQPADDDADVEAEGLDGDVDYPTEDKSDDELNS